MGWNVSSIIIASKKEINNENLLDLLGYEIIKKIDNKLLDDAIYPEENQVYIGNYKNNLIICPYDLPVVFYQYSISEVEGKLMELFPDSEICAVSLQSAINHYGFALIKNGQKLRIKVGDAINGTSIDLGEPLEQELALLSKSKVNVNGQRLYYLDGNLDSEYAEHQVGENFVFEIFKRFTGESPNDDELMDAEFKGYEVIKKPIPFVDYFTGEWQGRYILGDGYPENLKGTIEKFTIYGNLTGYGSVTGECIDDDKQSEDPATIDGFLNGNFIGFIKKYPYLSYYDENGIAQSNKFLQSVNIEYSGLYDAFTNSFKGIWRIEDSDNWGNWEMTKI